MAADQGPAISSTPKACGLLSFYLRRRRVVAPVESTGLTPLAGVLDLVAQISEVIGVYTQAAHLLDDRKKVGQRADRAQAPWSRLVV